MPLGSIDFERRARIHKTIDKAYQSLRETELLHQAGFIGGTLTRAYSAMFHGASAVLLSRDLDIIKPSAAVAFFDREVVKQGLIETEYQRLFGKAYEAYTAAEYDLDARLERETADGIVSDAREFVVRMERFLKETGWS